MNILGTGQQVFIQKADSKSKSLCTLVGAKENAYLILEAPFIQESAISAKAGETYIVRFLDKGKVVGFRTRLEKLLFDPFPMMILRYPKEMEIHDLRRENRVDCNFPARVKPVEGDDGEKDDPAEDAEALSRHFPRLPHHATLVNFCESGFLAAIPVLRLDDELPLPEGFPSGLRPESQRDYYMEKLRTTYRLSDPVGLDFTLPAPVDQEFESVGAAVRWVKVSDSHYFLGVEVQASNPEVVRGINLTLEHQRAFFTSPFS